MRRLAFLAAASLAFAAISEPISANEKKYKKCMKECSSTLSKCQKKCDPKGKYLKEGFKKKIKSTYKPCMVCHEVEEYLDDL